MGDIQKAGLDIAGQIVQTGIGMGIAGWQDRRQLRQQRKLQNLQLEGMRSSTDYQAQKEYEMWLKTNYGPQMEQLKKAGLNPALMYGMGGAGGATMGGSGAAPAGGHAPTGGGEIMGMMELGNQVAQRKLIEAQTENVKAQTAKTSGVDTEKTQVETKSLAQGIENQKAAEQLTQTQNRIAKIDEWIKGKSAEDAVEIIMWQSEKILNEVELLSRENIVNKATMNDRIDTIKQELAIKVLTQGLIRAQTQTEKGKPALQKAEIEVLTEQATDIVRKGMQKWQEIENQGGELGIERTKELREEMKATGVPSDIVDKVVDLIIIRKIFGGSEKTPETRGFHKR